MSSSYEYWKERYDQWKKEDDRTEEEFLQDLSKIYWEMRQNILNEIYAFYAKYAADEGISIEEARKRVTRLDMEEFEQKAKYYVELAQQDFANNSDANADIYFSDQANEEMVLYNLTMKANRLDMLNSQVGIILTSRFDDINRKMDELLTNETYKQYERMSGILGMTVSDPQVTRINAKAVANASFMGATFSERLWGNNQQALKKQLHSEMVKAMMQGKGAAPLAASLQKKFNQSEYACKRLIVTELSRVRAEANAQNMTDNGFDEYVFLPQTNACPICLPLNDKHFKLKDREPGKNYPPMHPNCRCTTAPWVEEEESKETRDVTDEGQSSGNGDSELIFEKYKDITNELRKEPLPGYFEVEEGYKLGDHDEEILFGEWLAEHMGGKLIGQKERDIEQISWCDYLWENEFWELKTLIGESKKRVDTVTRTAMKQIFSAEENFGGGIAKGLTVGRCCGNRGTSYQKAETRT